MFDTSPIPQKIFEDRRNCFSGFNSLSKSYLSLIQKISDTSIAERKCWKHFNRRSNCSKPAVIEIFNIFRQEVFTVVCCRFVVFEKENQFSRRYRWFHRLYHSMVLIHYNLLYTCTNTCTYTCTYTCTNTCTYKLSCADTKRCWENIYLIG